MSGNSEKIKTTLTALLPMKGHSERVPNKNIRPFAGKPLYHHIAGVLQQCPYIENILVNTDSEKIAAEAPLFFSKVKIIKRPRHICGDDVPMNEIIAHDLRNSEDKYYLQTHSTNPLLCLETLKEAIATYFSLGDACDSLFSVTRMQTRLYWESGEPVNHDPKELRRTQDLPPLFEENSNIYLFSRESFQAAGNRRIGLKPKMFEMNPLEATDIDTEENFLLAEAIYATRKK